MKRTIFILASIFALSVFSSTNTAQAQHVSININIGSQPAWGPVGYDYVDYYYMPEINCYYGIGNMMFYYFDRGRWVSSRYLPPYYSRYDMYSTYKVVINGSHNPWRYNNRHRNDYRRYSSYHNQPVIRYSDDRRYSNSRRNTYDWVENGRDLHTRSNNAGRGNATNGRYSNDRTPSTREANSTVGRGSNVNTREASSSAGRGSNVNSRETREATSSGGRVAAPTSRESNARSGQRSDYSTNRSTSNRGSNVSNSRSSQGNQRGSSSNTGRSSSDRGSNSGRPASGR